MKLPLAMLVVASVALAGCVMPPELQDKMTEEEQQAQEAEAQTPAPPSRKARDLEIPDEPPFYNGAEIIELGDSDAITGVAVTTFKGSVLVAPYEGEGWAVEAGLVDLDFVCQPTGNAQNKFVVLTEVVDGILHVSVEYNPTERGPLDDLLKTESSWVDLKVRVPKDISSVSLGEERDGAQYYDGWQIGWCSSYSYGSHVYGLTSEKITVASQNEVVHLAALDVGAAMVSAANGPVYVRDSMFRTLVVDNANAGIHLEAITADEVTATSSNGAIYAKDVSSAITTLTTSNAGIKAILSEEDGGILNLKSSNGAIIVDGPTKKAYGYLVSAETSNSRVDVDLPDFEAEENSTKEAVTGQTKDFSTKEFRYELHADTSNAKISIS